VSDEKARKIQPTERETHDFYKRQRRMTTQPKIDCSSRSRKRCITTKRRYIPSWYHLADFLPLGFAMKAKSSKKREALLQRPTTSIDLCGPVFFVCYDIRRASKPNDEARWIIFRGRLHVGDRNDLGGFLVD
jgi:hypothetical protein